MRTIEIKGKVLGRGVPATITSVMGADISACEEEVRRGLEAGVDCFEYRADFAADIHDTAALVACARQVAALLPGNPVLFTFRSASQGGQATLAPSDYIALCRAVIADGAVDAIDIESWIGDEAVRDLCEAARGAQMVPVVSYHDFEHTPPADDIVQMLMHFDELGAAIPKVALMASSPQDALTLLAATDRVRSQADTGPLLTMAMGPYGFITRLVGELFGSALTFCSVDEASAPGQVEIGQARQIMGQLHDIAARQNLDGV